MRMTVRLKVALMAVVGALALIIVASIALTSAARSKDTAHEVAQLSTGLSRQWNADMMHDGIRGDVMAALYADDATERKTFEVDDVTQKSTDMLGHIDAAAALAPAALAEDFRTARSEVATYGTMATEIVKLAATDKSAAAAKLPAFLDQFSALEEQLGALDEGMLTATSEANRQAEQSVSDAQRKILISSITAVLVFALIAFWLARGLSRAVGRLRQVLDGIAQRDLTVRAELAGNDEFTDMSKALNSALDEIGGTIAEAGRAAKTLTAECERLGVVSDQLGELAGNSADQAGAAAASARQVSSHVQTMSAATDQMDAAINEIAGQTSTAAGVAAEAAQSAADTSVTVAKLNEASEEIGEIVKAITSIAEQTNLLALNATIEAARAGEAGKGFAVVANEVKELAHETGQATSDITNKIVTIQTITSQAADSIGAINRVIERINQNTGMIATAVEEQSATTAEITRSVLEVSQGAEQIATNVEGIADSVQATSAGAESTRSSTHTLHEVAREVDAQIARFRV